MLQNNEKSEFLENLIQMFLDHSDESLMETAASDSGKVISKLMTI